MENALLSSPIDPKPLIDCILAKSTTSQLKQILIDHPGIANATDANGTQKVSPYDFRPFELEN
jgi:hypothetical protein